MVKGVPAELDAIYAYPHKKDMARIKPDDAADLLTTGNQGMAKFRVHEPYVMFVPLSDMRGRSLFDISPGAKGGALRAFATLFLAQVVRDGARLYVSLRTRNDVPLGYYWVLYEKEETAGGDGAEAAAAADAADTRADAGAEQKARENDGDSGSEGGGSDGSDDGAAAAGGLAGVAAQMQEDIQRALEQVSGGGDDKKYIYTNRMSIVQWIAHRIMMVGAHPRYCTELGYQHGSGDNHGGGGGGGGTGARTLPPDQLRWWLDLTNFATPQDLSDACTQLLQGSKVVMSEKRDVEACVSELLRHTLNIEKATAACAMEGKRSDEDYKELQHSELLSMVHPEIVGIPKDGVHSYCITPVGGAASGCSA